VSAGGTVDISLHEKNLDGSLKELCAASGGPWGGTYVDKNYIDWLKEMFGEAAIERLKRESMGDYFDIVRELESKKTRSIASDSDDLITLRVSASLKKYHEEAEKNKLYQKLQY